MGFKSLSLILLGLCSFAVVPAWSQTRIFNQEYAKLGLFTIQYSGENGKSFTEDSSSIGIEASKVMMGSWFGIETKVRGGQMSGTQDFEDQGASVNSDYVYYFSEFALGMRFHFIPARKSGFTAYLAGGGLVGFNYLSIDIPDDATSNLSGRQSSVGFGYEISAGGEFRIASGMGDFYSLYMDVGVRKMSSKLANQTGFTLDGLSLSVGLGF